ncbi:MAG: serine hydrolase domain-containing protein [Bacteroidales bacterium]
MKIRTLALSGIAFILIILFRPGHTTESDPPADLSIHSETIREDSLPILKTIHKFDMFLRDSLHSTGCVGAAACIFHHDEIVYTLTYGVKRAGTKDSVDRHTVFRLASVSKGFAGVLAAILQEEGVISMDDRIIEYLPGFRLKDSVNTHDLAIRHVLNHTSGLVPHAYDNLAEDGKTIREIIPELATVDIAGIPGQYYGYQNVIFSLIDTLAVLKTKRDYSELVYRKIFRPLGMKDASTGYRGLVWNRNVAFPHDRINGEYHPRPLNTGYYNLLPAAGVNASIDDMGKWLAALLGFMPKKLDTAVINLITTPQVYTPLKRNYTRYWDPIEARYYSFGWRIFDYKEKRILYHGGYVRGYRAEIAFCPEENTGIVFLLNSPNRLASQVVPAFFNMYLETQANP